MTLEEMEEDYASKQSAHLQPTCSRPALSDKDIRVRLFNPLFLEPPHKVINHEQVALLAASMAEYGWVGPPLIGYSVNYQIQLLNGTHRRVAAIMAKIRVPVLVYDQESVWEVCGDEPTWQRMMLGEGI